MFFDDEMLVKVLKGYNYSDQYIENFSEEIKNLFFELVIAHTFNFYASQNSQTEIDALEQLMKETRIYGRFEDQQKIMNILKETILKYPELSEQITNLQSELQKTLLMSFLKHSKEDTQIEIFTYLIEMKKTLIKKREILNKTSTTS